MSCVFTLVFVGLSPVEEYDRSWEQNEELGLNDIDTSSADAMVKEDNFEG